jgi:hypothetical protein
MVAVAVAEELPLVEVATRLLVVMVALALKVAFFSRFGMNNYD